MTDAELLLLSKFWGAGQALNYIRGRTDLWDPVLKRPSMEVIMEFLTNGLLRQADLHELLDFKFCARDLEAMLRSQGLKVSGTKSAKIRRLIEADQEEIARLVDGLDLVRCTETGQALVDQFLAKQQEEKTRAEQDSIAALEAGDYFLACKVFADFHAKQVFRHGLNYDPGVLDRLQLRRLELIARATPRIVSTMRHDALPHIRRAAQIMELWGRELAETWLPDGLETGLRLDAITAATMISSYVYNNLRLEGIDDLALFLKGVRVSSISDESHCRECAALDGKMFAVEELPELPYEHCTSEQGCRCVTVVVTVGDNS